MSRDRSQLAEDATQSLSQRRAPLTAAGAGEYLGTTERHVRELVNRGEIPFFKVGPRLIRFSPDALDQWIAAHSVGGVK